MKLAIWVARIAGAMIVGVAVMMAATIIGIIVSPDAHGLPVALTGAISFTAGFVPALIASRKIGV